MGDKTGGHDGPSNAHASDAAQTGAPFQIPTRSTTAFASSIAITDIILGGGLLFRETSSLVAAPSHFAGQENVLIGRSPMECDLGTETSLIKALAASLGQL